MLRLNHHYSKLQGKYLFPEIERRVFLFKEKNTIPLYNLGIGDITRPIGKSIVQALSQASLEMGEEGSFKGYGPTEGYLFLREAIAKHEYGHLGINPDEIFISDGAQSDMANFQELFAADNKIGLQDPTYPVYLDSNIMAGRTKTLNKSGKYGGVTYLVCNEENGFQPVPPKEPLDLVYLCFPNNPTGVSFDRDLLQKWVNYARTHKAILLIDGAYSAFITEEGLPKSIYEIEGAKEVAVEFRTFSKSAGFTGLRCSYTVVPHALQVEDLGKRHSLHTLWKRRQDTKFNGVAYPTQKAAAATFTPIGQKEVALTVASYLEGTTQLKKALQELGYTVFGGVNSPYVWCKTPDEFDSWGFFDYLLNTHGIVTVPGVGFGKEGEGYVRFSGFANTTDINGAINQLKVLCAP